MIITAKSEPSEDYFLIIEKAGLRAVELFLSGIILKDVKRLIKLCKRFGFRYAVHAPNDNSDFSRLAELVSAIGAGVVVFHNIYWDNEWEKIAKIFSGVNAKLCIENTCSVHEPLKFMRKFGMGRCLDLEHLQLECCGIFEEEFARAIKQASHIHLTGYKYGSSLWHTHIHQSPGHSLYFLNLLRDCGYTGLVVSEAKISLQTYDEFAKLNNFYKKWAGSVK